MLVANTSLGIVNSKVVKAHGGTDAVGADKKDKAEGYLNKTSAGSGPYVLKTMNVSSQVTLAVNTNYWGAKRPTFPNVVIRNTLAAAQLLNVQRGTNEIALDLSPDQGRRLKGKSNLQVLETPSPNMIFLLANHSSKVSAITSNVHFQNAIRYGIDYNGMVKLAGSGAAQAVGVIPSMFLGALPVEQRGQVRPGQGQVRAGRVGHLEPEGQARVPQRPQRRTASPSGSWPSASSRTSTRSASTPS